MSIQNFSNPPVSPSINIFAFPSQDMLAVYKTIRVVARSFGFDLGEEKSDRQLKNEIKSQPYGLTFSLNSFSGSVVVEPPSSGPNSKEIRKIVEKAFSDMSLYSGQKSPTRQLFDRKIPRTP